MFSRCFTNNGIALLIDLDTANIPSGDLRVWGVVCGLGFISLIGDPFLWMKGSHVKASWGVGRCTGAHMLWTYAALQAALFKMCNLRAQPWLQGRARVPLSTHCLHLSPFAVLGNDARSPASLHTGAESNLRVRVLGGAEEDSQGLPSRGGSSGLMFS